LRSTAVAAWQSALARGCQPPGRCCGVLCCCSAPRRPQQQHRSARSAAPPSRWHAKPRPGCAAPHHPAPRCGDAGAAAWCELGSMLVAGWQALVEAACTGGSCTPDHVTALCEGCEATSSWQQRPRNARHSSELFRQCRQRLAATRHRVVETQHPSQPLHRPKRSAQWAGSRSGARPVARASHHAACTAAGRLSARLCWDRRKQLARRARRQLCGTRTDATQQHAGCGRPRRTAAGAWAPSRW
jgi:hypothetical protein